MHLGWFLLAMIKRSSVTRLCWIDRNRRPSTDMCLRSNKDPNLRRPISFKRLRSLASVKNTEPSGLLTSFNTIPNKSASAWETSGLYQKAGSCTTLHGSIRRPELNPEPGGRAHGCDKWTRPGITSYSCVCGINAIDCVQTVGMITIRPLELKLYLLIFPLLCQGLHSVDVIWQH